MIENYAAEKENEVPEIQPVSLATVGTVYADGLTLIFPGEAAASTKRYKCNTTCTFTAGNRVLLQKVSGTYIALFPVGNPKMT